jgi:hypothetical protein
MTTETSAFYSHLSRFHVAVDCIIFTVDDDVLKVLMVRRDFEPEKGKWSLIGGFVGDGESVDNAAKRVLSDLTGLDNVFIRQLGAFGEVDRDPGARVVSVAYFALLNLRDVDEGVVKAHHAEWVDVDNLPELGFDHKDMIGSALDVMRRKILTGSLAFNMLPALFTLTQLQTLVETVTGKKLDKRNFRKRIAENPEIERTGLIDKETSKRGAMLYRYLGT